MLTSFNSRAITVGCLLVWTGIILGFALLAVAQFVNDGVARWGIAVICISCTYSVHRRLGVREDERRRSFELGREHERHNLTAVR